jgi:hypothetical protein
VNAIYIGFVLDKLNISFIPYLLKHIRKSFNQLIHPPSRWHPCPFKSLKWSGMQQKGAFD